jgi:hypothetical protein
MKKHIIKVLGLSLLISVCGRSLGFGQINPKTIKKVTDLRDDFINKIKSFGFTPNLPAPAIIFTNPPAYGNYNDSANILEMGDWTTLPNEKKAYFIAEAKQIGNGETGESFFEKGIYKWVMIHELGH